MMFLRRVASKLIKSRFRIHFSQISISNTKRVSYENVSNDQNSSFNHRNSGLWLFLSTNSAIILGLNSSPLVLAEENLENDPEWSSDIFELRKIEDDSIVSNDHTIKWRLLTDHGRNLSLQGKLKEAEGFFLSAIQEAKEGFGKRDPHVASACNNLAELYRVSRKFDKAEPLYLEAVNLLEESYGPDDIRVGAALHNLGQFYLLQRNLEEARKFYERALKIKGRALGLNHEDYSDTMYHLGMVLHLQGKEEDAEPLILDSIIILEESGQAESITCLRRMRNLAQIYLKTSRLEEAENIQRKILHTLESKKGWNSLETVIAAEGLALTLQLSGNLEEAQELLERCLDTRKALLPSDHIQIGANMLFLARLAKLKADKLVKLDASKAITELDKTNILINDSIRITEKILDKLMKQSGKIRSYGASEGAKKIGRDALIILLQSNNTLGLVEIAKSELQESKLANSPIVEAENALLRCISAYKKFETESAISGSREVKAEYLSCLKHFVGLMSNNAAERQRISKVLDLQDIKNEIDRLEIRISQEK